MARVVDADPDLSGKIKGHLYNVRLKITSGDTPAAVDWKSVLPFRIGNQNFRNISDIRNLNANEYFKDKRVRIREKGLHKPKDNYDGHYDMLVDIYDIQEDMLDKTKVPIDSTMCFHKASKKMKKSKKRTRKSKKQTKKINKKQIGGSFHLIHSTQKGNIMDVRKCLDNHDDPNFQSSVGATALFSTLYNENENDSEIATLLLDRGADPDIQNDAGKTALMIASSRLNDHMVKLLLDRGADPNIQDRNENTALIYTIEKERTKNDSSYIVELLLDHGADPNIQGREKTALIMAASINDCDHIVELLLENGADPNIQLKSYGDTALISAVTVKGNAKTIELLLENGADITLKNNDGNDAIMMALDYGKDENALIIQQHVKAKEVALQEAKQKLAVATSLIPGQDTPVKNLDYDTLRELLSKSVKASKKKKKSKKQTKKSKRSKKRSKRSKKRSKRSKKRSKRSKKRSKK